MCVRVHVLVRTCQQGRNQSQCSRIPGKRKPSAFYCRKKFITHCYNFFASCASNYLDLAVAFYLEVISNRKVARIQIDFSDFSLFIVVFLIQHHSLILAFLVISLLYILESFFQKNIGFWGLALPTQSIYLIETKLSTLEC